MVWLLAVAVLFLGCATALQDGVSTATAPALVTTEQNDPTPVLHVMGPASPLAVDKELAAFCSRETGTEIQWLLAPQSPLERLSLYQQFLATGADDVDLLFFDVTWSGLLAEHLVDLSPFLTPAEVAAFFQVYIDNNTIDGRLIGLPWVGDVGVLYVRTDLLDKYGYRRPPRTWDELSEMAAVIQVGERNAGIEDFWGYVWQGNVYEGLTANALEWQASHGGGTIMAADGTVTIANPQAAAALDRAAAWVGTISPPGVLAFEEEEAQGVWQTGRAAFMRNWPYAYIFGQAEDSPIRGKFAVIPLPRSEDGYHAGTIGGWQVGVSRYSRYPEAAVAAGRCLLDVEAQTVRALEGGTIPTLVSLYREPAVIASNPLLSTLLPIFQDMAVARPAAALGEHYLVASAFYFTKVHAVLSGSQSGAHAVAEIEAQLQELTE